MQASHRPISFLLVRTICGTCVRVSKRDHSVSAQRGPVHRAQIVHDHVSERGSGIAYSVRARRFLPNEGAYSSAQSRPFGRCRVESHDQR
jgi:hypothetical protein